MSAVVLQQVFVADDLHGKAGADQRAEDWLRRADHDAFLLPAVGIFAVSAGQQSLYGGILGRQVRAHFLNRYRCNVERFTDPEHSLEPHPLAVFPDGEHIYRDGEYTVTCMEVADSAVVLLIHDLA